MSSQELALAMSLHQAGEFRQAEKIYRQILQANAAHADAWHLLGVIALQERRPDLAIDHIRRAIGSDRRIGSSFLFPGIGFGGSCFPKDIKALIKFAGDKGYEFQTLKAVERVNEAQKVRFIAKLEAHFGSLKGKTIALWGLSFKPRTDDMREAPAIPLINRLLKAKARVQAFDPQAGSVARRIFGNKIAVADKSYDALKGADALVIATEWNEFREPDFDKMRKVLKRPVIFDGRNIYNPEQMKALGFTYYSVGR